MWMDFTELPAQNNCRRFTATSGRFAVRSAERSKTITTCRFAILPTCRHCQALLRPHIVWFGESLSAKRPRPLRRGTSSLRRPACDRNLRRGLSGGRFCVGREGGRRVRGGDQSRADAAIGSGRSLAPRTRERCRPAIALIFLQAEDNSSNVRIASTPVAFVLTLSIEQNGTQSGLRRLLPHRPAGCPRHAWPLPDRRHVFPARAEKFSAKASQRGPSWKSSQSSKASAMPNPRNTVKSRESKLEMMPSSIRCSLSLVSVGSVSGNSFQDPGSSNTSNTRQKIHRTARTSRRDRTHCVRCRTTKAVRSA